MTKNFPVIRERCPRCGGIRTYRHGHNKLANGIIRWRWYCPDCDRTFQEMNKSIAYKTNIRAYMNKAIAEIITSCDRPIDS